ncbi:MAG: hypothetical protein RR008_03620 [Clostridia bacterium]
MAKDRVAVVNNVKTMAEEKVADATAARSLCYFFLCPVAVETAGVKKVAEWDADVVAVAI